MYRYCCGAKNLFLLVCISTTAVLLLYYCSTSYNFQLTHDTNAGLTSPTIRDRPVVIYHSPDFASAVPSGFAIFHRNGCPVRNCVLTKADSHKHTADVVIFGENSAWNPHFARPPNQIWIIRLLESPENTQTLKNYEGKINFTASYHSDSDLPMPYGVFKPLPVARESKAAINHAKGKTRMVLWLVSHCLTNNRRMLYAQRLSKYVQVDIYGSCGKGSLTKEGAQRIIRNNYKFYLAFENSNCRQYITEKFWINALSNDVVPIVMGAPKGDYMKVAPPNSFIHVDDYEPQELARYLLYLNHNDTAYNEYFAWKNHGRIIGSNFYCRLCSFVQSPPTKTYDNIDSWWRNTGGRIGGDSLRLMSQYAGDRQSPRRFCRCYFCY